MIHFKNLKFEPCLNHQDNNSKAELSMDNGYLLDIIKKPKTRTYKVKPFDIINGKKMYLPSVFPEYGVFPEFAGRELLVVFLNEIVKHDLSDTGSELDEEISEDEL